MGSGSRKSDGTRLLPNHAVLPYFYLHLHFYVSPTSSFSAFHCITDLVLFTVSGQGELLLTFFVIVA